MLNFHHLRAFWMVAREGSLTRAARKHNIAQSALSTQISALEAYLGQPLFDRAGRRLTLTEAGHVALDFANAIFATGDDLLSVFGRLGKAQQRTLRVGALATLSRNFQMRLLRPLLGEQASKLVIRSGTMEELLSKLKSYELDVVLSDVSPPRSRTAPWIVHVIDTQPVGLIGAPDPERQQASLEALLQREPLVVPTPESNVRIGFDALMEQLGIRPRIVAEVDDMAMLRLVAREHRGLAVLPPIVVKDELEAGLLVEFARLPGLAETFCAITVPRRFPNPLLRLILPRRASASD